MNKKNREPNLYESIEALKQAIHNMTMEFIEMIQLKRFLIWLNKKLKK